MDSKSLKILVCSDDQNQISYGIGHRIVESFSIDIVKSAQLPNVDSPSSSMFTNKVSFHSAVVNCESLDASAISKSLIIYHRENH